MVLTASFLPKAHAETSWACGQFEDNRILATVGAPSKVVYAVNLGGAALTTANGYAFQAGSGNPNVSFVSTTTSGYLGGGGTTGDANFDQILGTGAVATSANTNGMIQFKNLTNGKYYRIMLLFADTQAASSGGSITVSAWGSSDVVSHTYAYNAGTQGIGAYASFDFVPSGGAAFAYINSASSNRQINAVIVSEVKAADLTSQAVTPTLNTNERVVYMATPEMFGALGDGVHNDAPAFNAAAQSIAMMGVRTSGVLYLANKKYLCKDPVNVLPGVTIHGDWKNWTTGTTGATGATFVVKTGTGTTPFLNLRNSNAVIGANFWYPDQSASSIQAYGVTISGAYNCVLRNIVLINSYDGIFVGDHHTLENIYGSPLHTGYSVEVSAQQSYVSELHYSPTYWTKSLLAGAPATGGPHETWMYNNGTAILLGRDDGDSFISCSIDGYMTGCYLRRHIDTVTPSLSGATGGSFIDSTISHTKTALMIDDTNASVGIHFTRCTLSGNVALQRSSGSSGAIALLFHTCTITSELGNGSAAIMSPVQTSPDGLQLTNCTVNGQILQSGGSLDLVNCTLNTVTGTPQIGMMTGTAVTAVAGCTYTPAKSIANWASARLIDSPRAATTTTPPTFHWSTVETRRVAAKPALNTLYVATASPYNAIGDGVHDDTANIQSALNAAGTAGGGIVYLPTGRYLTSGTLAIPSGVELRGPWETSHSLGGYRFGSNINTTNRSSSIWVTAGAGSTTGAPAATLAANSGIVGVDFDYVNQTPTPVAYPTTIVGQGANIYLIGVTCPNAYNFIDLDSASCTNHFVYQVQGLAFEKAIKIGNGATGIAAQCDIAPNYWAFMTDSPSAGVIAQPTPSASNTAMRTYLQNHSTMVWLGNCPSEKLVNVTGLGVQYYLFATNEGTSGPVAEIYGALSDNNTVSFHLDGAATNTSINAVNSYWMLPNAFDASALSQPMVSIETAANFGGKARFYNIGSRMNQAAYDFRIAGGTIGVEGYSALVGANAGSLITGGCAQLTNVALGTSGTTYQLTFSGRGVFGKMSEFTNWRTPKALAYTNTDPTNQALYAANAYAIANTTVVTDQPIFANALYTFQNLGNSMAMDNAGSLTSGTDVTQWTSLNNLNQQWTILYDNVTTSPATYRIQSRKSGFYLDSLGHTAAGTTVGQLASSASNSQKWFLYSYGAGRYQLVNAANNLVVDTGGSTTTGTSLTFAALGSTTNTTRIWNAIPAAYVPEGNWSFQNRTSSLMIDNLGTLSDGAQMGQKTDSTSINQQWTATYNIDGYYRLRSNTSIFYLDDLGGSLATGTVVKLLHDATTNDEQWTFDPTDTGYFKIRNRTNGLVVDNHGSTTDGSLIYFESPTTAATTNDQQWKYTAP